MNVIYKILIGVAITLVILGLTWCNGYNTYHKKNPCPTVTQNTVYVHDTIHHNIPNDIYHYVYRTDTIIRVDSFPRHVDTAFILRDYYAKHFYTRTWTDSLLSVELKDMVTENKPYPQKFTYEILRPQTVNVTKVDNSVVHNRYVYLGIDVPIKSVNDYQVEGIYAFTKGYLGAGFQPSNGGIYIKGGLKLFTFKKHK